MTEQKPAKTTRKQSGKFKPGQSGNPKGRPQGSRHKSTMAALSLLEGQVEALTQKAVDLALDGDLTALRLCLERLISPAKDRPVSIALPSVKSASDLPKMTAALLQAASCGEIGATEAAGLMKIVEGHRAAIEISDLTARIEKLENEVKR
jgi:hypothetical protein